MKSGLVVALIFVAAFSWPALAHIQRPPCGSHTEIIDRLAKTYAESRVGFGQFDDGRPVEIFASPGGTWTLLVTWPNGVTCLVASGDGWQNVVIEEEIKR